MYFSTPTLLFLLGASLSAAAPTYDDNYKPDHKDDHKWGHPSKLFYFDATYEVHATPDQVISTANVPTPGQPGAKGVFKYGINVAENTICYNITLSGVTGDYASPAVTATHIHEAVKGRSGPPRLAFPNPKGPDSRRTSYGCLTGPFFVGTNNTAGVDNAAGFHVGQIVANPSGFFTDSHTVHYTAGAVRGQLS